MTTIPAVRQALAAQITAQIPNLRNAPTVPGEISPPMIVVRPARDKVIDYQQTLDGAVNMYFEAVILAAAGHDRTAQNTLDGFLSPAGANSVHAAVQHDPTLGGVVAWAAVISARGYGDIPWAGTDYLGSILLVEAAAP